MLKTINSKITPEMLKTSSLIEITSKPNEFGTTFKTVFYPAMSSEKICLKTFEKRNYDTDFSSSVWNVIPIGVASDIINQIIQKRKDGNKKSMMYFKIKASDETEPYDHPIAIGQVKILVPEINNMKGCHVKLPRKQSLLPSKDRCPIEVNFKKML